MRPLVFLLLALGLLAARNPSGSAILQAALSSEAPDPGEVPNRGWEIDPNGSPTPSEETDRGWAIDPNG